MIVLAVLGENELRRLVVEHFEARGCEKVHRVDIRVDAINDADGGVRLVHSAVVLGEG